VPQDVTPAEFTGLSFPEIQPPEPSRRFVREAKDDVQIASPAEAAHYLMQRIYTPFEAFDQEEMWLLLLNTKGWITHEVMVYRGTVNMAYVRVAELFKEAVRVNAPSILLSHCHPSGAPTPSPEEIEMTRHADLKIALCLYI